MKTLLHSIFASVGSFASIIALVISVHVRDDPFTPWQYGLIIAVGVFALWAIFSEIKAYIQLRKQTNRIVFAIDDQNGINRYMYNWIRHGNRCAIFTRNMSWANDKKIMDLLLTKAKDKDLNIYIPEDTDISKELRSASAEVYTYEDLKITPMSRFTVVNWGKAGMRVAIGKQIGKNDHVIEEYSDEDSPLVAVTVDLLNIIEKYHRNRAEQFRSPS